MDRFIYRIFQFCQERHLIQDHDNVLISVSGGIDSTALLRILVAFREKLDIELNAVHFNHGLRNESEEEEVFVRDLADTHQIHLDIIRADHLTKGKSVQNEARTWRYAHLIRLFKEKNASKIALGHHLNDLVETQIWRMIRGGSLFSLSPIQVMNSPYIRPLLTTQKSELEIYLNTIGQPWKEDSSNATIDYTRNMIRHQLIPLITNITDGGRFEEKMLALCEDSLRLREMFDQTISPEKYEVDALDYRTLTDLPPLFEFEVIHRFLLYHGQEEISRSHIEEISRLVRTGRGDWTINLKQGLDVFGNRRKIRIRNRRNTNE